MGQYQRVFSRPMLLRHRCASGPVPRVSHCLRSSSIPIRIRVRLPSDHAATRKAARNAYGSGDSRGTSQTLLAGARSLLLSDPLGG
jgi:hypothetical protein